ncbi:MAG: flagellar biosynthetic protein FliO [Gammaproteobacteria bacterium]|nr:flagellar biosynthetic protein FliO [Gammaproteobacteria bacterium]
MSDQITIIADKADNAAGAIAPVVGGGELLGMGVSMAVVIATILVLGWFYSRSRLAGSGASDLINVVATRALGPKERLIIVEIADHQLLLGLTSTSVQTLHVFDTPVVTVTEAAVRPGFAERLKAAVKEIRQ